MLTLYCVFPRAAGDRADPTLHSGYSANVLLGRPNVARFSFSDVYSFGFSEATLSIPVFSFHFMDHPTPGNDITFSPSLACSSSICSFDEDGDLDGAVAFGIGISCCGGNLTDGLVCIASPGITLSKTGVTVIAELRPLADCRLDLDWAVR